MAKDGVTADIILRGTIGRSGAETVTIDMPEPNDVALQLAHNLRLKPNLETAIMYLGKAPAPAVDLSRLFGLATVE